MKLGADLHTHGGSREYDSNGWKGSNGGERPAPHEEQEEEEEEEEEEEGADSGPTG